MRVVLDDGAYMPVKAHKTDAGYDIFSPVDAVVPASRSETKYYASGGPVTCCETGSMVIDTGVHIELPEGTTGFLKSKSGLNVNYGITSEGVIDVGYTGSIRVKLYNHTGKPYIINRGDKISQLVVLPIVDVGEFEVVEELSETDRGSNGFGSTGR